MVLVPGTGTLQGTRTWHWNLEWYSYLALEPVMKLTTDAYMLVWHLNTNTEPRVRKDRTGDPSSENGLSQQHGGKHLEILRAYV